jgi:hypothetical protein
MNFKAILSDSLMITGFVFVMMLLVEYLQVFSAGLLGRWLQRGGFFRIAAVALVATVPGCLGAFTDVTLYTHGMISFGTLAGAMIAASGDEAFVMLALFPGSALLLFGLLFGFGVLVALLVDRLSGPRFYKKGCCPEGIVLHEGEVPGSPTKLLRASFKECSLQRATLGLTLALFILATGLGWIGPETWNWIRWTLILVATLALFVVLSVPEHFLNEHLYKHVAKKHAPRVFLWVLGVLLLLAWLNAADLPLGDWIKAHPGLALIAAVLVGVIPESGPHLIFVTLFAQGLLPFSVLAASSVVQDGHGMLPLLAESPWEFVKVKAVNIFAGLSLGVALAAWGV